MTDVTILAIDDIAPYEGDHAIDGINFRAARTALGVSAWGMNVLDLEPHCKNHPLHDHKKDGQEEVYVVLLGTAVLLVEGQEHKLEAGTMARVPAALPRQLVTAERPARILALGGTPDAVYSGGVG